MSGAECAQRRESLSASAEATHISRGVCSFSLGQNCRLTAPQSAGPGMSQSAVVCIIGHVIIPPSSGLCLLTPSRFSRHSVPRSAALLYTLYLCGRPRDDNGRAFLAKPEKIWPSRLGDGSAIIY